MSNQFTFDHIIQKVNNRCDIIKYIRSIYGILELLKDCQNCGNSVLGPCFQILFLVPFIVQQSSCHKKNRLLCFNVVWLSFFLMKLCVSLPSVIVKSPGHIHF